MKLALLLLLTLQASTAQSGPAISIPPEQPKGAHGVRNEQYGLFLRPRDASNRDGEPIVLYPYQPWKCMAWHFDPTEKGTRLVNFFTGKSFEIQVTSGRKALMQSPASPEKKNSESFHFVALGNASYEIATEGGDALTAVGTESNGVIRVVVTPWKNTTAQRWQLVDIPEHFTM